MSAVSLSQEDKICAGAAGESRCAGQCSGGGLRQREGEECGTRIVSAKEGLRRARLENESLMITLNRYKIRVRNVENKLDEEELNGMAMPWELKRLK